MNQTTATPLTTTRFDLGLQPQSPLRQAITAACRRPEAESVAKLLPGAQMDDAARSAIDALAYRLAAALRQRQPGLGRAGLVQGLLQEFALSSQEGVALMCLAEALLRIPDAATRDALIRDKIGGGDWSQHLGRSPSLFVNAAAWGLLLTGKLVATHSEAGLAGALGRIVGRSGEPLIRKGVDLAMRLMGQQFVAGQTIAQALRHARTLEAQGFRYSYDMLGEAALTEVDALRYLASYQTAIAAIGQAAAGLGLYAGPGISIKLSALHPRYGRAQRQRVQAELYPRLLQLALQARHYDIGLNIDAEESDRLELSLDLLERLCFEPALAGWHGIGFVIQCYLKRCPEVVSWLIELAQRSRHRLMLRLVKGAYWDSEIKRAQIDGLSDFPVYTRKAHSDLAYIACARRLLDAPEAIYPQFATHNAQTLAAIVEIAGADAGPQRYEFQCLHGMGEPLYEQVVRSVAQGGLGRACRIYAPVGTHETLLAYLVRRLLENGANTSFVNRIADPSVSIEALIEDPLAVLLRAALGGVVGLPHPGIATPPRLFGEQRRNAVGLDLTDEQQLAALLPGLQASAAQPWQAAPMLGDGAADPAQAAWQEVSNPADRRDLVGRVQYASAAQIEHALALAVAAAPRWAALAPAQRAALLERAAEAFEQALPTLLGLLLREAGKSLANALAELREAVDFLRYYAAQVRRDFDNASHIPLGPVVCISPWNFPLAIFTGQIAAALAAGNPVLAKPAEQTPLVAAQAVQLLRQAGVPAEVLQLLPGTGPEVGQRLVADARVQAVLFTGSTEVARLLQATLAQRLGRHGQPVPLIAETGGQNAMIVDSSALLEQVAADVLVSAFDSAGQRCSALRLLCVQQEVAERLIGLLEGAMQQYQLGNPAALAVDIGPVIDASAQHVIEQHIATLRARGRPVRQAARTVADDLAHGSFVMPTLIEIERLDELQREVFGPVLHLLRYRRENLGALLQQINQTGYGLTLGLHTRIDETIGQVLAQAHVGNVYVNRNMVGAVVGVQPFGGEGLSGTGPKAGGPLYLYRLLAQRPADLLRHALASNSAPADAGAALATAAVPPVPLRALRDWVLQPSQTGLARIADLCDALVAGLPSQFSTVLPGPTGERNVYSVLARDAVLCLADDDVGRLCQLAGVLALGGHALWPSAAQALAERLPSAVRASITLTDDWSVAGTAQGTVLYQGDDAALLDLLQQLSCRPGPVVSVQRTSADVAGLPLERLLIERSVSINTAAAGGNASLMSIG